MEPLEPSELRALLRQALVTTRTDEDLAASIVDSGALSLVAELATASVIETAQTLGIQTDSVRKLMRKSSTFPGPVIDGRRFSTAEVCHYRDTRGKRS